MMGKTTLLYNVRDQIEMKRAWRICFRDTAGIIFPVDSAEVACTGETACISEYVLMSLHL